MTTVVGRVPWGQKAPSGGAGGADFFRLDKDGTYKFRFLASAPVIWYQHWVPNSDGKPTPVRCSLQGCTLCKEAKVLMDSSDDAKQKLGAAQRRKKKFAVEAYLFDQDKPVILEGPGMVSDIISSLEGKVEGLEKQVLSITRDYAGNKNKPALIYSVIPLGPKEFNAEQVTKIKEFMGRTDLVKIFTVPKDEDNLRKLGRLGDPAQQASTAAPLREVVAAVGGETEKAGGQPWTNESDW